MLTYKKHSGSSVSLLNDFLKINSALVPCDFNILKKYETVHLIYTTMKQLKRVFLTREVIGCSEVGGFHCEAAARAVESQGSTDKGLS